MPTTTLSKTSFTLDDGDEQVQFRTTMPKQLAEAMDLDGGEKLEWQILSKSAVRVDVINNE